MVIECGCVGSEVMVCVWIGYVLYEVVVCFEVFIFVWLVVVFEVCDVEKVILWIECFIVVCDIFEFCVEII